LPTIYEHHPHLLYIRIIQLQQLASCCDVFTGSRDSLIGLASNVNRVFIIVLDFIDNILFSIEQQTGTLIEALLQED